MNIIPYLESQLGVVAWPLLICSVFTLAILLERFIQIVLYSYVGGKTIKKLLDQHVYNDQKSLDLLIQKLKAPRPLLNQGLVMLIAHSNFDKSLREDIAVIWLQKKRVQLHSGLKLLGLIGVICPLLGLLGTVLGLIDMFKEIATLTGAVTPNDLARGLGLAMRTTAAGLFIALPAICGVQLLNIWAGMVLMKLEHVMNQCNLWLEGIDVFSAQRLAVNHQESIS